MMARKLKAIPRDSKIASLLLSIRFEFNGELLPAIDREKAKDKTAEQILSLFEWNHIVPVAVARALGWTDDEINHPTNVEALIKQEHRRVTAERDVPMIAKGKRLALAHRDHLQRREIALDKKLVLSDDSRSESVESPKSQIRRRVWPKRKLSTKPGESRLSGKPQWPKRKLSQNRNKPDRPAKLSRRFNPPE